MLAHKTWIYDPEAVMTGAGPILSVGGSRREVVFEGFQRIVWMDHGRLPDGATHALLVPIGSFWADRDLTMWWVGPDLKVSLDNLEDYYSKYAFLGEEGLWGQRVLIRSADLIPVLERIISDGEVPADDPRIIRL